MDFPIAIAIIYAKLLMSSSEIIYCFSYWLIVTKPLFLKTRSKP